MPEIKTRTLKLQPVKVKYTDGNKIPFAAVPKRKATTREAMYILRNILGFDLDLSLDDCESREEMDEVNFACFLWLVEYCQKVGIL